MGTVYWTGIGFWAVTFASREIATYAGLIACVPAATLFYRSFRAHTLKADGGRLTVWTMFRTYRLAVSDVESFDSGTKYVGANLRRCLIARLQDGTCCDLGKAINVSVKGALPHGRLAPLVEALNGYVSAHREAETASGSATAATGPIS